MNTLSKAHRVSLMLIAAILLAGLAGCQPEGLVYDPQSGHWVSPLPTATPPTSPLPTPTAIGDEVDPTLPPSPTAPPVPTLLPTPVVTPIPTAVPPIIPEVVGKAQQPFWIVYWQGDEVWRIDDQGKEQQLLLDTYKSLGLYLSAEPYLESGGGLRVTISPDGQKLALVLIDKAKLTRQREPVTFSIYLFDIQTGDFTFLSEGGWPKWSPDGRRIAFRQGTTASDRFVWDPGLWVADLETGEIDQLVNADPAHRDFLISNWVWSPDSQQIAYQLSQGYQPIPGIWVIDLEKKSSTLIPGTEALFDRFPLGLHVGRWLADGQHLLVIAEDPVKGLEHVSSLWILSIQSGELTQLTQDMTVTGGVLSPDGKWIAINATRHYELEHQPYDVWLLSVDDATLLRVTAAPPQDISVRWSPDGTRLIFSREGVGLVTLSLDNGVLTPLGIDPGLDFVLGGAK